MLKNITLSKGVRKRKDFLRFLIFIFLGPKCKKNNTLRRSTKEEGVFEVLFWEGSKCKKITPKQGVQKRRGF